MMKYLPFIPGVASLFVIFVMIQTYKHFGLDEYFYLQAVVFGIFVLIAVVMWSANRIVDALGKLPQAKKISDTAASQARKK